tara:strand:+ start:1351 stop:1893 length:543 start_codon:yes stop_codon:yes gene_type:complete
MYNIFAVLIVLALGLVFSLWDMSSAPNGVRVTAQHIKKPAPDFTFTALNGRTYTLSDFKGKTVLINFWATWCPPCIVEMPDLLKLAQREEDNIIFIALSVNEDLADIEQFFKTMPEDTRPLLNKDNIIFAHDHDKTISKDLYNTTIYPESYIIRDGEIIKKIQGITDWLGDDIASLLARP